MSSMHILPLYASILALMFVGLSVRTLRMRRRLKIAVGDAGNPTMLRAMRVHSNFAEYVPLSLLLIFLVEAGGANPLLVHFLGSTLLLGRVSHAYGVSQIRENFRFRVVGMALTFTSMISSSLYLIYSSASTLGA
ncbi:MAG: MAPEG family protein [Burkholderiaceae bacterium]